MNFCLPLKELTLGPSLVVQWLRLHAPNAGGPGLIPGQETGSHMPQLRPDMVFKVKVLVTQLYLTLCDPMDCNPPGSSVHGIPQARILEWVAIAFSRGSS